MDQDKCPDCGHPIGKPSFCAHPMNHADLPKSVNKEPIFSASQISTYMDCARKWAWDRIAHKPRPQNRSAALGTRCHTQLEAYLRDGRPLQETQEDGRPDETAAIVRVALPALPAPQSPGLEIEKPFAFRSPRTGYSYRGFIDFRYPGPEQEWCTVGDHKSTSNLSYAKTPDQLLYDPQAILYAVDSMAYYQVPNVHLLWSYMQTGVKRHLPVYQDMTQPHVGEAFAAIEETAGEMKKVLDTVGPDDILGMYPDGVDRGTCTAYGGCPYVGDCNLGPKERMGSLFAGL
jgi:PD-(D/E)XK nuclease superfamily protein